MATNSPLTNYKRPGNAGQIVVNATALDISGALTILKQFLEAIPIDEFEYIVFVHPEVNFIHIQPNVKLVKMDVKSLIKRFAWDLYGLDRWLKKHDFNVVASISLQNTNFRISKPIPNFIYYHQSIPFFRKNWNPFSGKEKTLWFYSKLYPYFIKLLINNRTEVFVQSNFIRNSFAKFFHFPFEKIYIVTPNMEMPVVEQDDLVPLDETLYHLFYPATPFIYKNHGIIIKALSMLDEDLQKKIVLHLTCSREELISLLSIDEVLFKINFLGKIPFSQVVGLYKKADALLFPSYIETLGLPLIEAGSLGVPVIVSDLPYSREVLNAYEGATFVDYNNPELWKEAILSLFQNKGKRYQSLKIEKSSSWTELFQIVKSKINRNV